MSEKKLPWTATAFVAFFCLVISQLAVIFIAQSAKLDKIYVITNLFAAPLLFLYLGHSFSVRRDTGRLLAFNAYALVLAVILVTVFGLGMNKKLSLKYYTDEKLILILLVCVLLALITPFVKKLNAPALFAAFVLVWAVGMIPIVRENAGLLPMNAAFFFAGAAISKAAGESERKHDPEQKGERYVSVIISIIILRQIVFCGWWTDILKSVTEEHWILIYTITAFLMCFVCSAWCTDIFVGFLMWPVGRFAGRGSKLEEFAANLRKYRFLLKELIKKGIVLKYRRSFFGILWSLFEPLLTMLVLTFVFSNFFGDKDPFYPVYILTGRLMFSLFQTTTSQAMKSIRSNASMIKKVYVPKYMYPLSSIMFNFVLFLISLIDLVLVMIWFKVPLSVHTVSAVVPVLVLLLFSVGVGMIIATVNVFFRDIEYLWGVFCLLLMYCSAIFYRPDKLITSSKGWVLKLNPVYQLIYNFRRTIIYGQGLDAASMVYALVMSGIVLFVGFTVFYKKQDEFILHI